MYDYHSRESIYGIKIANSEKLFSEIVKGEVVSLKDGRPDNFEFFLYEAFLLKFRKDILNDIKISDTTMKRWLKRFKELNRKDFNIKCNTLDNYITDLNTNFVKIGTYFFPINLTSRCRQDLEPYCKFLERAKNIDVDIETFIRHNLR